MTTTISGSTLRHLGPPGSQAQRQRGFSESAAWCNFFGALKGYHWDLAQHDIGGYYMMLSEIIWHYHDTFILIYMV